MKIKNYSEFLLESENKFQKFYVLVKNRLLENVVEHPLALMRKKTFDKLFKQIEVDLSSYKKIKLENDIPIINLCEDNYTVEKMITTKIINRDNLYNQPEKAEMISNKELFHKVFKHSKFIPKTVFKKIDTESLKFPIIAKPAKGHSGEGIQKFKNKDDLEKSNVTFDVFSEMIDIDKEYRCFCFRGNLLNLNERIKIGKKDFLENANLKTNFYYKEINFNSSILKKDINILIEECKKKIDLDFYSLDFAVDKEGKFFIIEMNARSGMGADKAIELYEEVYKDFYKKKPSDSIEKFLSTTKSEWKEIYADEKTKELNECTTVAGIIDGKPFLFKNRDRSFTPENVIIREKRKNIEIIYYTDQTGWVEGMNEYGVGFVMTMLIGKLRKGYAPTYNVTDEPKEEGNFNKFREGILDILTAKNADEALAKLEKTKKSGSFFISDGKTFYDIEIFEGKIEKRKLEFNSIKYYIKTNHGKLIPEAGHQPSGESIKRASSELRSHQADVQLQSVNSIEEIPNRMKFQAFDSGSSLNTFRTDDEEHTISQCLMDLKNMKFYFYHDENTADSLKIEENNVKSPKIKLEIIKYTNGNKCN